MPRQSGGWASLVPFLLAVTVVALLGSLATGPALPWYRTLERPAFTPPDWVFGPAWTLLYALMAIAAWRTWRRRERPGAGLALLAWGVQLALNAAWSPVFFGLRSPGLGLAVIVLLLAALVATVVAFARVDRVAAWMLAPYLAWSVYAAALNFAIVALN